MGHRKRKVTKSDASGQSYASGYSGVSSQSIWIRDPSSFLREVPLMDIRPTRLESLYYTDIDTAPLPTIKSYGKVVLVNPKSESKPIPKTPSQKIKTFFMDTISRYIISSIFSDENNTEYQRRIAIGKIQEATKKQEEIKQEEKKKQTLQLKGIYRERIKELTDENIALKYELERLKNKYENSTH